MSSSAAEAPSGVNLGGECLTNNTNADLVSEGNSFETNNTPPSIQEASQPEIVISVPQVDRERRGIKKNRARQLAVVGKLTLRLIKGLDEYFEEYDESDLDELSEDEELLESGRNIGELPEASPFLQAQEDPQVGEFDDQEKLAPATSENVPAGPVFKAEMYKYIRDKETGAWNSRLTTTLDEASPVMVDEEDESSSTLRSTFEVTTMYAMAKSSINENAFGGLGVGRDKTTKAIAKLGTHMTIHSTAILADIRQLVDYYPMVSFQMSPLVLVEPFCILLHYKEELTQLRDSRKGSTSGGSTDGEQPGNAGQEVSHLTPLLEYLSKTFDSAIAREKARWEMPRPMCTFEWLWLLFKPGSTVVSWKNDVPVAFTIQSHEKEAKPDGKGRVRPPEVSSGPLTFRRWAKLLTLKMWSIHFDGRMLGRLQETVFIQPFEGEKPIDSLPIIPIEFWKDVQNGISREALKDRLIKRGTEFFKLTKRTYCQYHGKAMSWPNRMISGRIMVDSELRYSDEVFGGSTSSRPILGFEEDQERIESISIGQDLRYSHQRPETVRTHPDDDIDPFKIEKLTDKQYMICSPSVWGFVTKLRRWELLNVENISPLVLQVDMINDLVLESDAKDMIKALSRSYTTQSDSKIQGPGRWSADFVQNKGDGQIFLLHGKPGVGKTTTAECVSELTKRPLLSLTCGDLGIVPVEVETKLMQWLRLGTVWEAILLLDEADVYLESRRAQDLQRNSLVSIFLRALEYYQGILFLTSNRVGTFDDAFISRIHVIIHYPPFQDEQREKIWNTFFRRLENDRPNMRITPSVHDFVSTDEGLKKLEWNGREIRNAFNTAVALAEYENDVIDFHGQQMINFHRRHLEQVVKMSKAFQQYLTKTHGADETRRAKLERIRDDTASTS